MVLAAAVVFVGMQGCGFVANVKDIKTMTVGASVVKTQEQVRVAVKFKADKERRVIYGPAVDYGSVDKEERLSFSSKTDVSYYRLFEYKLYYDYSQPDNVLILIRTRVDFKYKFLSATALTGDKFDLNNKYIDSVIIKPDGDYMELYTIAVPLTYLQKNQDKGIVIDLLSDTTTTVMFKKQNLSRTFHIAPYYLKAFVDAIDYYKNKDK